MGLRRKKTKKKLKEKKKRNKLSAGGKVTSLEIGSRRILAERTRAKKPCRI